MPVETGITGIQDLNAAWPEGTDYKTFGDDHLRNIKEAIQLSFPNMTDPWTTTDKPTVGGLDVTGNRIENVPAPVDRDDAVAYSYTARDFGTVNESGTNLGGTSGWICSRLATGHFRFTFTDAASDRLNQVMACQVIAGAVLVGWCQVDLVSDTQIDVYTMTAAGPVNLGFSFVRRYRLP